MKKIVTNKGFDDGDRLREIREGFLNPLGTKVADVIEPKVNKAEQDIKSSYKDAEIITATKTLKLTPHEGPAKELDLSSVIPEPFKGVTVSDETNTVNDVTHLTFEESSVIKHNGFTNVSYDWSTLVPSHQDKIYAEKDKDGAKIVNRFKFTGNTQGITISGGMATVELPDSTAQLLAKVDDGTGGGVEKPFTKILVNGNTTGSEVTDTGELVIKLPIPGTGATGGNFQGFYENLGDLEASVTTPVNGKSYAFVKDAKLKNQYYTPYFYVSNGWTEAPIDPSLTYETPSGTEIKGVFSIKPNPRIKIDVNGQLDLDGLEDGHFLGFFNTVAELGAACQRPTLDRSCGYIFNSATMVYTLHKYSRNSAGEQVWERVVPYGMISAITKEGTAIKTAKPIFGIEENEMVTVSGGLATIKDTSSKTVMVKAKDSEDHIEQTKPVKGFHFVDGIYVDLTKEPDWAVIHHPQKVIHYNSDFEKKHNSSVYLGHIFYDDNHGQWMGYSPDTAKPTEPKWAPIAYRGMSDEVKSLDERFPIRSEDINPGNLGDNGQWFHTGWSYVDNAADVGIEPEDIYKNFGLHIMTFVRKGSGDGDVIPKYRLQVGFIEDLRNGVSETWSRTTNVNATGQDPVWREWVKCAASAKDLKDHNSDPKAHSDSNPFYRVYTFDHKYKYLKSVLNYLIENDLMITATSSGGGVGLSDQAFTIPYSGSYNLRGRFAIDQLFNTAGGVPSKNWELKITRQRLNTPNVNYNFLHTNAQSNQEYDVSMKWELLNTKFEKGDTLFFNFLCLNDSNFTTTYPFVKLIPMRSYIVIEDSRTAVGTRLAESFRRTTGVLNQRDSAGVNIHRRDYAETGGIRVYGRPINTDFKPMTKA